MSCCSETSNGDWTVSDGRWNPARSIDSFLRLFWSQRLWHEAVLRYRLGNGQQIKDDARRIFVLRRVLRTRNKGQVRICWRRSLPPSLVRFVLKARIGAQVPGTAKTICQYPSAQIKERDSFVNTMTLDNIMHLLMHSRSVHSDTDHLFGKMKKWMMATPEQTDRLEL